MKKRPFFILFIVAMIVSPPVFAQQTASRAILDELDNAAALAGEARKKAGDFASDAYFPGEWEAAEEQYSQAALLPKDSDADARNAIAAYNAAADSFESIFALAVPLYAQAREDEIMEARGLLVEERAKELFPEYFVPADEAALLALDEYEAGDYYPARESAARALLMYQCLAVAYKARAAMWEIEEREFEFHDIDSFERAGEILAGAMDAYNGGDIPSAGENAEEALLRFTLILSAGWAEYAEMHSAIAESEHQAALNMKTNIAAREFFTIADHIRQEANELFDAEEYEEAAKLFVNSEAMYVIAGMSATEKRRIAAEAIREALNKIEESDRRAREAEIILEGGLQ